MNPSKQVPSVPAVPSPDDSLQKSEGTRATVKPEKLLRLGAVEDLCGLRKSSIYAGMKARTFPPCVRLSTRAVAWRESDIAAWQSQRQQAGGQP